MAASPARKILYVVLDGAGDRPTAALGGRTPLAAAQTPHLDRLAARGQLGLVYTVGPEIAPESDVAVTAILGYDPHTAHVGRGPLEALGAGVPFREGDLALRGNFATLGSGWRIVDRRVGRNLTAEEARALAEAVTAEVRLREVPAEVEVRASVGHRCAVVLRRRDGRFSAAVSNTDPAYGRVGGLGVARAAAGDEVEEARPLDDSPEARAAAAAMNEFTRRVRELLDRHPVNARRRAAGKLPANIILLRDAGDRLPAVPPIAERFGVRLGCVVEMPVERGIARVLGMEVVEIAPGAGYRAWAATARQALRAYDGLYLHLKGPDEPGHDGDAARKVDSLERIDAEFFGPLLDQAEREWLWAVTADHATPVDARAHTADPVPLLVAPLEPPDGGRFTEADAARGALGTLRGVDILPLLVRLARPEPGPA